LNLHGGTEFSADDAADVGQLGIACYVKVVQNKCGVYKMGIHRNIAKKGWHPLITSTANEGNFLIIHKLERELPA
jgi:hypothetical protein